MRNAMSQRKRILFTALMILGVALASEALLQVTCLILPRANSMLSQDHHVPTLDDRYNVIRDGDVQLGSRPNPARPDHDRKGFRNLFVPEEVDIVALGDSQTYGSGVPPESAWPQQLARLSDFTVYNMGYAGSGPTDSIVLLDEAIRLHPKLVIEAFYAGNDLHDSYCHVYDRNQLTWLKSADETLQRQIRKAEEDERSGKRASKSPLYPRSNNTSVRKWFSKYSRLYGLFSAVTRSIGSADKIWESRKQSAAERNYYVYEDDQFRTILRPTLRLYALDLADPRILEGQNICRKAIKALRERTQSKDIDFILLLIPTKELVFKELVLRDPSRMTSKYQRLIENEETFWAATKEFLDGRSIYWVDALPALRQCLQEGNQPYQMTQDGHPNAAGHEAIAKLVLAGIRNAGIKLKR